jgi:glutamyl-tRNA synthetase
MANKQKPRYDHHCRDLAPHSTDEPYVIRFKNPLTGEVVIEDQIKGRVVVSNQELDDLIIVRSDGTPTYNFCVVVDDYDMQITHVIRGDDHLNNTPRQMNILAAMGRQPPVYAHIPMILGPDGKKLSKRHGAVSVLQYQEEGYLPQALLNYLVRLGWSHGDQEIFSKDELIELFEINAVNKAASAFNGSKLLWLNQHYLKTSPEQDLLPLLAARLQAKGVALDQGPALSEVLALLRERAKTLVELADQALIFYQAPASLDPELKAKHLPVTFTPVLAALVAKLTGLTEWTDEAIHQALLAICADFELKMGQLAPPVRVAITGGVVSPSINATLRVLGQAETLRRLARAQ